METSRCVLNACTQLCPACIRSTVSCMHTSISNCVLHATKSCARQAYTRLRLSCIHAAESWMHTSCVLHAYQLCPACNHTGGICIRRYNCDCMHTHAQLCPPCVHPLPAYTFYTCSCVLNTSKQLCVKGICSNELGTAISKAFLHSSF